MNYEEAYTFYKFLKSNYDKKRKIYEKLGFSLAGAISYRDWEVFVAILMNDRCKPGDGCDLLRHEVKSALRGNSYEYQYHRNKGLEKLTGDKSEITFTFLTKSITIL